MLVYLYYSSSSQRLSIKDCLRFPLLRSIEKPYINNHDKKAVNFFILQLFCMVFKNHSLGPKTLLRISGVSIIFARFANVSLMLGASNLHWESLRTSSKFGSFAWIT